MKHIKKVSVMKAQACDDIGGIVLDPALIIDCVKEALCEVNDIFCKDTGEG